jgi:hypothetical protein
MIKKFLFVLCVCGLFTGGAVFGQAVPAPYNEGTVWNVSTIRVKYGMTDDYMKSLGGTYKKMMEELKKEGAILNYKIFMGPPADKGDWDVMLMIEYKNMAALDGADVKFRAAEAKVVGGEAAQHDLMAKRVEIREVLGEKIVREITLK